MEIFARQWGPKVNLAKFKVMTYVNENIVIENETVEKFAFLGSVVPVTSEE